MAAWHAPSSPWRYGAPRCPPAREPGKAEATLASARTVNSPDGDRAGHREPGASGAGASEPSVRHGYAELVLTRRSMATRPVPDPGLSPLLGARSNGAVMAVGGPRGGIAMTVR